MTAFCYWAPPGIRRFCPENLTLVIHWQLAPLGSTGSCLNVIEKWDEAKRRWRARATRGALEEAEAYAWARQAQDHPHGPRGPCARSVTSGWRSQYLSPRSSDPAARGTRRHPPPRVRLHDYSGGLHENSGGLHENSGRIERKKEEKFVQSQERMT